MEIIYYISIFLVITGIAALIRITLDFRESFAKIIAWRNDVDLIKLQIDDIDNKLCRIEDMIEACAKCERIIYENQNKLEDAINKTRDEIKDINEYIDMISSTVVPTIRDTYNLLTEGSLSMTINEYQQMALRTESPTTNETDRILQGAMGLCGESGEYIDILKKHMFQGHELDKKHMAKELGDIAWYLAVSADAIDYDLETIFQMNIDKLKARYPEGFETNKSTHRKADDI